MNRSTGVPPVTPLTPPRERGFTLIELLVVMSILVVLLSLSAGVYLRVIASNAVPAAAGQVANIIRSARNSSNVTSMPSKVFIEVERKRVTAFLYETVGAWAFEESGVYSGERIRTGLEGAYREVLEPRGEVYADRGKIGQAVSFAGESYLTAEHRPRYNSSSGVSLEAWVRFYPPELTERDLKQRRQRPGAWVDPRRALEYSVMSKGDAYELGLRGDGGVYFELTSAEESSYLVLTGPRAVWPDRWTHLRVTFDGTELSIEVDGSAQYWWPDGFRDAKSEAWPALPSRLRASNEPLYVSHPDRPFLGRIDQAKFMVALEPTQYELPPQAFFDHARSFTIHFDSRGALDPLIHNEPVQVRISGVPAEEPSEPTAQTGVVPGVRETEEGTDGSTEGEPIVEDPLEALLDYLEGLHREENGEEAEESAQESLENPADLEIIIVELTGTVRG